MIDARIRRGWHAGVLTTAAMLIACRMSDRPAGGGDAAAPPDPAPASVVLADAALAGSAGRLQIVDVARTNTEWVTVTFVVANQGTVALELATVFGAAERDRDPLSGVYVFEEAGGKRYYALHDDRGSLLASSGAATIAPGERRTIWVRFAGPAPVVERLSVQVPGLPPFRNLAVTARS